MVTTPLADHVALSRELLNKIFSHKTFKKQSSKTYFRIEQLNKIILKIKKKEAMSSYFNDDN